jgi:3-dehydroquinate dehydratase
VYVSPRIYGTTALAQIEEAACTTRRAWASTSPSVSRITTGVICGLGPHGYIAAMHTLAQLAKKSGSEPTRITPNEWASVLSSLFFVHFKVSE